MSKVSAEFIHRDVVDLIRRLVVLAEIDDKAILSHVDRIRGYVMTLGRGLGLSPQEAEIIAFASQLHDVGKIALPEALRMKAGKLEPGEWELVKQHPVIGAELLSGSPSVTVQAGEIIALTHHERWDGSGYPRGLKGEAIPLSGRLCAVADVYDALTTPRPYKVEIAPDEALTLIKDSGGTLFDPQVVAVFVERFDEILRTQRSTP
jgi:putative two-component system response regulator